MHRTAVKIVGRIKDELVIGAEPEIFFEEPEIVIELGNEFGGI